MWLVQFIPPKNSAYPSKTKGTFSWNSAYHQSCKNYELLVDSSDFGIYGCEQKMYYWWKSSANLGCMKPFISTHTLSTSSGYNMLSINRMPDFFFQITYCRNTTFISFATPDRFFECAIFGTWDIIQTQEIRARFCRRYFHVHDILKLNIVNILLRAGYKGKGPWFWMNIRKKFQTCFTFFLGGTSKPMTVIQVDAMASKPNTLSMSLVVVSQ